MNRNDIYALQLVSKNIKDTLENYELLKKTIKIEVAIFRMQDNKALEEMGDKMDYDSNLEYIHYLEAQQHKLLKIVEKFIDKM